MIRIRRTPVLASFLFAAASAVPAWADEPVIQLISPAPSTTVSVPGFPASVPVSFTVGHDQLGRVNVLRVISTGTTVPADTAGNPFSSTACNVQVQNLGYTSCTVSGTLATLGFNWGIPGPGQYTLQISAKHTNDLGQEQEVVTFQLLSVEYPAPPAVANRYINTFYKGMKPGVRGCIISAVAELHAHDSAYGPKGGPYDEPAIRQDVEDFKVDCGG